MSLYCDIILVSFCEHIFMELAGRKKGEVYLKVHGQECSKWASWFRGWEVVQVACVQTLSFREFRDVGL